MFTVSAWSGLWTPPGLHALAPALPFLILWEGFWKGLALWHLGRRGQSIWFVILIVVKTIGILPINLSLRCRASKGLRTLHQEDVEFEMRTALIGQMA